MGVERMCFGKWKDRDGFVGEIDDLMCHAKASVGVARVLSQLLFMLNADKEVDQEALLHAAITHIDDDVLAKMLSALVQDKYLLDASIRFKEETLSIQQKHKEVLEARMYKMLKFERARYDRLWEMDVKLHAGISNRLFMFIESWYYTEEDEALLHLKLDYFLSKCDIIKEDSTLHGVKERLNLPEEFASISATLIETAILRRIYRLKSLASIQPYKKFLREVISKIVGEVMKQGQHFHHSVYFLTFLDDETCHFLKGRDKDPFLDELRSLAEKCSLGKYEYVLERSLDHCSIILSMSSSAGEIDQALDKFVEELKREAERQWFDGGAHFSLIYSAALRKLQQEVEPRQEGLNQQLFVHRSFMTPDNKVEPRRESLDQPLSMLSIHGSSMIQDKAEENKKIAEVLPIPSSYGSNLEDVRWVRSVVCDAYDALSINTKMRLFDGTEMCSWHSALKDIADIWKRVDLLHEELLVKISSSCLFFFEILRGMQLPQLTHIFQKISRGEHDEKNFVHVDKKLKKTTCLADNVLENPEKYKANFPVDKKLKKTTCLADSWQAIDLNPMQNPVAELLPFSVSELINFAEAFSKATKHMKKEHRNAGHSASHFGDQSRVDCVKERLQGYIDSYRRECRLTEDISRMSEHDKVLSNMDLNLQNVKILHDQIEDAAKGNVVLAEKLGAYHCDIIDWWNYRRLSQDASIKSYIDPMEEVYAHI